MRAQSDSPRRKRCGCSHGKTSTSPSTASSTIGAFEHFGFNKYDDFFKRTYGLLPDDGVMLLQTIVVPSEQEAQERQLKLTMSKLRFIKFIMDEIFPGGRLPHVAQVRHHAGYRWLRRHARAAAPSALRPDAGHLGRQPRSQEAEAIAITSQEVFDRYIRYLTGCADLFREGYTDVCQFTCEKTSFRGAGPPTGSVA